MVGNGYEGRRRVGGVYWLTGARPRENVTWEKSRSTRREVANSNKPIIPFLLQLLSKYLCCLFLEFACFFSSLLCIYSLHFFVQKFVSHQQRHHIHQRFFLHNHTFRQVSLDFKA